MKAIELIKKWEGCKLKAYYDSVEIATIGYGTTYYEDVRKVKITDKITQKRADELLQLHIEKLDMEIRKKIFIPLKENQFDSLISLVYNIGINAFLKSTLLKRINTYAPLMDIEKEWMRWCRAGGKILKGLENRRIDEFKNYKL